MNFELEQSLTILNRTPKVLNSLLSGLGEEWVMHNEGPNTWSPYDVLGHLIHGEKTDWIPRSEIILSGTENKAFVPFDRFAQMNQPMQTLEELLNEFEALRMKNITKLQSWNLTEEEYQKTGIHPEFGEVTLQELLSTWTVHDLGHLAQISRVMARQYASEVGPWRAYLGILHQ